MTAADLDTTALADLDVDLDKAIPCESRHGCDAEAAHRAIQRHGGSGEHCATQLLCEVHAARHRAFLASPGRNVCRRHRLEVYVLWQPLQPGGR